jgi:hypothetical protein
MLSDVTLCSGSSSARRRFLIAPVTHGYHGAQCLSVPAVANIDLLTF